MLKLKVINQEKINQKFIGLEKVAALRAFDRAVEDVASKIGEIASKDVPVMEGILKSTFTYQKISNVWYIGYNTEYAMYQHEGRRKDGTRIIRNRRGGGKSKFLTDSVTRNKQAILQLLSVQFYKYLSQELSRIF